MPNITRNAIVNCAELVTYDMIKELILKYDLMTGEQKNQLVVESADYIVTSMLMSFATKLKEQNVSRKNRLCLLFLCRQPALPLHSRFWCRLLHNSCGLSCGCGQNTVHELRSWPVQQRKQLCSHHAEK